MRNFRHRLVDGKPDDPNDFKRLMQVGKPADSGARAFILHRLKSRFHDQRNMQNFAFIVSDLAAAGSESRWRCADVLSFVKSVLCACVNLSCGTRLGPASGLKVSFRLLDFRKPS